MGAIIEQPEPSATAAAASAGRTLVMMATYNEIGNLPRLVDDIFRWMPDCDVLVIDDGSPDGTGRWVDEQATHNPRLHALHRTGKQGLGSAILLGFRYAVEQGYRFVINMDADFSHPAKFLPAMVAGMDEPDGTPKYDVMIGSRYIPGGSIQGWPMKRYVMSWGVNVLARSLLGLRTKDCSGGYRCYRVELLKRLDTASFLSHGYSFQEEALWRLKRLGARFGETPIAFVDRIEGASKMNLKEVRMAFFTLFRLGVKNWVGV